MSENLQLTIIGGGSSYTPEIIAGLLDKYQELPISDLYLVDIEAGAERLKIIGELARRMAAAREIELNIHLTLDCRAAIKGADFIIAQFRVGLMESRIQDERIPLKYNCLGQETTGAGGLASALRTIPVILDICRDIEELAPNAWLINFTNPSGIVTETVNKQTAVNCLGVCNVPVVMEQVTADILNLPQEEVWLDLIGLNHLVWAQEVWYKQENKLGEVISCLQEQPEMEVANFADLHWNQEVIEILEMLPCPYHKYYYQTEEVLSEEKKAARREGTRGEVVKKIEKELFALYSDPNLTEKPAKLDERGGHYYSKVACDVMSAIYNDRRTIHYLNVQNDGLLDCLPADSVIERTCYVDGEGAHPIGCDELPTKIRGLIEVVNDYEALTIKAGVEGDYKAAYQALLLHPLVKSSVVKPLLDDIITANSDYLPQF